MATKPMNEPERETLVIGHFALACERMNEFAQSLRRSSLFMTVRVGADIRNYESGWRLEKWVEAELDKDKDLWAAWWLEFGLCKDGWIIESHLAVSPDAFFFAFENRIATSPQEFGQQLLGVIADLEHSLEQNQQFAEEVRKKRQRGPAD
jgi:hypothetical protein